MISLKNKSQYKREWALKMLSYRATIRNDHESFNNIINRLLDIYFANPNDEIVKNELLNFEIHFQTKIIEKIRLMTKDEEKKDDAEDLLQMLIKVWWNKGL
jgi:hypothetical protein